MTISKTFYIVDGILLGIQGLEFSTVAAARMRDAWRDASNPRVIWPFSMEDIGTTFMKNVPDASLHSRMPPVSDDGLASFLQDEVGDATALIYTMHLRSPLETDHREARDYPEPLVEVMEKPEGSDRIETMECTTLSHFVATNGRDDDPDKSVLYRIKLAWDEYALVHGAKLERVLQMVDGQSKGPVFGALVTFDEGHRNQLIRAMADHEFRHASRTPAP